MDTVLIFSYVPVERDKILRSIQMTKVYFSLFAQNIIGKTFSDDGINPGVGGTQFVTIMLALSLARQRPDYEIFLLNQSAVNIEKCPKNLDQLDYLSLHDALQGGILSSSDSIMICQMGALNSNLSDEQISRIVPWIHHPFHKAPDLLRLRFPVFVSVGDYQYHSNKLLYRPHWHISNLFFLPSFCKRKANVRQLPSSNQPLKLVYMGALSHGKGFHHLSRQWREIVAAFPNAELHVIGGSETHGVESQDPIIPTTKVYADLIRSHIPDNDLQTGRVTFHGNLGKEKTDIIKNSHVAILNPTGRTEAFPATPLECMSMGVPVIASDDFGMADAMRYFPELSLKSPFEIVDKLKWLTENSQRYEEMSNRSISVAHGFANRTPETLLRWQQIIDKIVSGDQRIESNPPHLSLHGSKILMAFRHAKNILKIGLKSLKNKARGEAKHR